VTGFYGNYCSDPTQTSNPETNIFFLVERRLNFMFLQRIADHDLFSANREMQRLQQHLNRLLFAGDSFTAQEFPPINVWTSDNEAIVRAELPGIEPGDVDISLVNDTLTIRGSRNPDAVTNGETCHRQERGCGQFTRTLQLPFTVNADQVQARFCSGVLQINLPRSEAEKARKIAVKHE
jgi:HSP20 family protein